MSDELWSVQDVATWAKISYNAAYKRLTTLRENHGLKFAAYGRAGALLYRPADVRAAWPLLPGSGAWKRKRGGSADDSDGDTGNTT